MAKNKESKGNEYVNITLNENQIDIRDMNNILSFIESHNNVYLFGEGLCGKGFSLFSETCGFDKIKGFITSNTFDNFLKKYIPNCDGIILTLKGDYYPEILPLVLKEIKLEDVLFLKERTKQIYSNLYSKEYLNNNFWLTLPLAQHCNINCASCNMFAPLCSPEFYTLENVKKDLLKIKALGLELNRINISGGEPFLNPEIVDILLFIQKTYPDLKVDVYTNGFLIASYNNEHIKKLKLNNVEYQITEYGLYTEKLQKVYEMFKKNNIKYIVNYKDDNKLFYKKQIDFEKKVPIYEYINCQYYTYAFSAFLFKGNLYKCPLAMNSKAINNYSEKKIVLTDKDYLKLDNITSSEQIYNFWRSRLPLCGYCPRVTEVIDWRKSERKIEEWI